MDPSVIEPTVGLGLATIFASQTVMLIMFISLAGTGLKTWAGMIGKPARTLNPNLVVFTFVISLIMSVSLVAPAIDNIDSTASPSEIVVIIFGQILAIYGSDSLFKRVKNALPAALRGTTKSGTDAKPSDI